MTQVRQSNLESTDASRSDNLPLVSPGASLYPESCRNGAALGSVPTLDITSKDRPSNIAILKDAHCWQEGGRVGKASWLSPHTAEEQKRMWYHSSLAMGEKQVADEWGFKSTSVSRSQSPHDTAEPRSAKDSRGMRRAGSL